ncbi:hypothetical protein [Legionella maioricensis]|uniref:Dot/Icm T4SS effector n=1 Tax=Legionella maioricensis TaxID=2896528 RepID=A0A9X2CYI7_9GAMM|nr:hypothetical protein [Legionella maioricensis]MCL9683126.1 hypothetical protein [Legionella maioricensis]MCL9688025.1 hypothetical protein [Legionella maioricensis]
MTRKKSDIQQAFSQAKNVRNQMFKSLNSCASYKSFKQFLEKHDLYKQTGSAYTLYPGLNIDQRTAIDQLDKNIEDLIPIKRALLGKNARLEVISLLRECNSYSEFDQIFEQLKDNMSYSFHEDTELECVALDKEINELISGITSRLAKQAREIILSSLRQCNDYSEFQKILEQDEKNKIYSFHSGLPEDKELLEKLDQEILQLIKAKKQELVPLVHIYTDFDGTITAAVGKRAVFSPFFQSLLVGDKEGVAQDYKNTPMKTPEEVQSLFEAKFGKYDEHFDHNQEDVQLLMSPKAVAFFHQVLKSSNVRVSIVTRNRRDYIEAMLRYQGFTELEIAQFNIMDTGYKYNDVYQHLNSQEEKPNLLFILDDDGGDCYQMVGAARVLNYTKSQLIEKNEDPGAFAWDTYPELFLIQQKEVPSVQLDKKEAPFPEEEQLSKEASLPEEEQLSKEALLPEEEQLSKEALLSKETLLRKEEQLRQEAQLRSAQKIIGKIDEALGTLKNNIGEVNQHHFPAAVEEANALLSALETATALYSAALVSGINIRNAEIEFKRSCEGAINDARTVLSRDLGWGDYLTNLLKAIANMVISVFTANPHALFKPAPSLSLEAVEAAAASLEIERNSLQASSAVY